MNVHQIFRQTSTITTFRSFHNASILSTKSVNPARQSKIMGKLLGGYKEKKKFYGPSGTSERSTPILQSAKDLSGASTRRVHVLNKLFMRNITDLMSTGSLSVVLVGKGLQISRVKITQDFRAVHVFWLSQGRSSEDENLEVTLKDIAGKLRHELSQLRVMGEVPRIFFVKDKQYAKFAEVDALLAKADFGEDYTPTDPSYRLKSDFQLEYQLPNETRAQIEKMDAESELDLSQPTEEQMPVMRHNVLGLEREEIMKRILGNVKKSQEAWRNYETKATPIAVVASEETEEVVATKEREFAKYLQKQSYAKKDKSGKNMLDLITMDYLRDRNLERLSQEDERIEVEDKDFIIEDDKNVK